MDRARTLSMYRLLHIFGLVAATMLLTLLLHLLIVHLLTARDAPPRKDTEYIIKHIDSCPSVGYYFKRETVPNTVEPGPCYLCFCQGDNTAVCWKRDNRRCNKESFHYHGVGKRDTRIRRSPGFADIFFRDATRDVFNKNEKSQCKPFESSFSDDCPPADWCIGCTVCDCDANGRWDCHVLSFCPEKKGKKKPKRKGPVRKIVAKKPVHKSKSVKPFTNLPKRTPLNTAKNSKITNKAKTKTTPSITRGSNSKTPPQKRIFKKSISVKPNITPKPQNRKTIRYKRIPNDKPDSTKKMIIKKNIATHRPIDIKSSKVNLEMEIAKKVMKKVMANLRKSVNGEMLNISNMANKEVQKKLTLNNNNRKTKPNPIKSMNKRQIHKPRRKPPQRKPPPRKPPKKYQKKPTKKPSKKPTKKPTKKPIKKPTKNPTKKPTRKPPKYVRNKRDLKLAEDIGISNISAQGNSGGNSGDPVNTTVAFSLTPVTSNLLVPGDDNCTHTTMRSNTLPANEYYKYFVGVGEPKVEIGIPTNDKETTEVKITETVFNLIGTKMPSIASGERRDSYNTDSNKTKTLSEINPEANELKYSKWSHLKILKERRFNSASERYKSLVKILTPINKTQIFEDFKNRVHGKDVERKLNNRKYSLIKLLSHSKCKENGGQNDNSSHIEISTKRIGDLQNLLTKLLREFHNNTAPKSRKKTKKFSVLRYLKRIFNKIFKRKKAPGRFSKHHIIETLCENFGPCKVSLKDKVLLQSKLTDLDAETTNILRTVKIIKGLLKLLNTSNNSDTDSSTRENIHNDIQKLNSILKGNYAKNKGSFSATQLTQIDYIKRNTQDFIQSVTNFATLLNEIISIMTKHDTNIAKNSNRILRNSIPNNNNFTKDNPFQSLRNLLERYNLIQNSFMKQMYEQLNNFESKMNENPKVSEVKDVNNSIAIENFSKNIIQNLRKLKRLAQSVSYSGRTKREAMRYDDAIEYLLILMEYLWKQNHPLDAAPVNDGIDLLIEAIKNAPDIKPIKKKVLDYTPAYTDITTTPLSTSYTTEDSLSDDESHSESDKTSSEDVNHARVRLEDTEDSFKNKIEENKELAEIIIEDDKDQEDKYQFDRRDGIEKKDDITENALYNRAEDNLVMESENALESTTFPTLEINDKSEKDDAQEDINNIHIDPSPFVVDDNNFDKPILESGINGKKIEVFTAEMDDEGMLPSLNSITISELPISAATEITTQAKKSRTKMRHLNLQSQDSESIDKQSKLEWIEENFGRENKNELTDMEEINVIDSTTTSPNISTTKKSDKIDVSVLTREDNDVVDMKKKGNVNNEDVIFKKQMDLLNSLDYGTEKSEADEPDSKDGNVEDKYSNDPYPSYFV